MSRREASFLAGMLALAAAAAASETTLHEIAAHLATESLEQVRARLYLA